MKRSTRWSLVLGVAGALAFAVPAMTSAYARGGGGGSGGGGGGAPKSPSGPKTGGGGMGGGAGKSKNSNGNAGSAKGRGDFLESLQRDEADDARAAFLSDATMEVLRAIRSGERGE